MSKRDAFQMPPGFLVIFSQNLGRRDIFAGAACDWEIFRKARVQDADGFVEGFGWKIATGGPTHRSQLRFLKCPERVKKCRFELSGQGGFWDAIFGLTPRSCGGSLKKIPFLQQGRGMSHASNYRAGSFCQKSQFLVRPLKIPFGPLSRAEKGAYWVVHIRPPFCASLPAYSRIFRSLKSAS